MCPGNGLPLPCILPEGGLTLAGHFIPAGVSKIFDIPYYLFIETTQIILLHDTDIHIPFQAVIGINAWVSNMNHQVFGADSAVFRPERWLDASKEQLSQMDS